MRVKMSKQPPNAKVQESLLNFLRFNKGVTEHLRKVLSALSFLLI